MYNTKKKVSVNRIIRNSNASTAVASILNPVHGYRDEQLKKGIIPKDFEKINRKNLRQQENRCKESVQKQKNAPVNAPFKLSKFKDVDSRYQLADKTVPTKPTPSQHEYLRKRSGASLNEVTNDADDILKFTRQLSDISLQPRHDRVHESIKPQIPTKRELSEWNHKLNEKKMVKASDYVSKNAVEVINAHAVKCPTKTHLLRHKSFGKIPTYLVNRKEAWAKEQEEARKNAPDPDCPPGMQLMPEDERFQALDVLAKSKAEARQQLHRLPLAIDTPSHIRKKNELEAKLREIDDAIKIFDRSKVYISASTAA